MGSEQSWQRYGTNHYVTITLQVNFFHCNFHETVKDTWMHIFVAWPTYVFFVAGKELIRDFSV